MKCLFLSKPWMSAVFVLLGLCHGLRAAESGPAVFDQSNLAAWCIVPFDRAKRTPEQRAAMLEKIGVKHFVYDYRAEHVKEWDDEMEALKRHNIHLLGWWFPGSLSPDALKALELFRRHGVKPQLWVSGGGAPLEPGAVEEQARRVANEVRRIKPIADAAKADGLTVGLYNHGGWFGEPDNQLAILEGLRAEGVQNAGIVYNQHHGHAHIPQFRELLKRMLPHLICLNLNGMDIKGDQVGRKILPLGAGTEDLPLLRVIAESGYRGPVGILNHTGEDAEARLLDNLDGLRWLSAQLSGGPVPEKPAWRTGVPAARTPGDAVSAPKPPAPAARGVPSINPAFGKALRGSFFTEGKPEYRTLPLTVECRARMSGFSGFNILVACDPKSSADHWELYTYANSGRLSVYLPGRCSVSGKANVCDDAWHSLAAVIGPDTVKVYVDGVLDAEATLKPAVGAPNPGRLAIGSLAEASLRCDGIIDNVRISSGARVPESPGQTPLKADEKTLGLWDFDALPD
jgi:hypothetical protein